MNEKQNNNLEKVFQDYFSNFESNPTNNVWENITDDLLDQEFKSNLDTLEVPASEDVWNHVISVVATDQLFNQSFDNLEVTPSSNNWSLIASTINFDEHFESTFHNFTEQPGSEVWDSISNHEFETHCRTKLKKLEVKPDEENWEIIKRAIPAVFPIRALMPHISRVAAILIVAISIPFLMNKSNLFNPSSTISVAQNEPAVITNTDHSLAVVAQNETTTNTNKSAVSTVNTNISKQSSYPNTDNRQAVNRRSFIDRFIGSPKSYNTQPQTASTLLPDNQLAEFVNNPSLNPVIELPVEEGEKNNRVFNKLNTNLNGQIVSNDNIDIQSLRPEKLNITASSYGQGSIESIVTSLKGQGNSSEFDELKLSDKLFSLTDNPRAVKMLNYSGLYVYIASQFSNTWIVNPEVQSQLSELKTAKYMVGFGGSTGVGFGFKFSPRIAVEAGWRRTTLNQKFREFVPDQLYLDNELKTVYNTYQALGKYTVKRLKTNRRNPITTSLAFGLHYRNLKNAMLEAETEFDNSVYINRELGLTGGLDLDFHLSESVTLNLGARASIGTDVKDLSTISSNSRFNNQYGIQAAVQYKISK